MTNSPHYIAIPKTGSGSGVLVLYSWWGLNAFFKCLCDRFANEGFVALAPDLYNGKVAYTIVEAKKLQSEATVSRRVPAYKMLIAGIEYLTKHEEILGQHVAIVGFSMGGYWSLWIDQRPEIPIASIVVFYAARNHDFRQSKSRLLFHFAETDEWVSAASIKKLKESLKSEGKDAVYYKYPGTAHWFFESDRTEAFHQKTATLAWKRTVAF